MLYLINTVHLNKGLSDYSSSGRLIFSPPYHAYLTYPLNIVQLTINPDNLSFRLQMNCSVHLIIHLKFPRTTVLLLEMSRKWVHRSRNDVISVHQISFMICRLLRPRFKSLDSILSIIRSI